MSILERRLSGSGEAKCCRYTVDCDMMIREMRQCVCV